MNTKRFLGSLLLAFAMTFTGHNAVGASSVVHVFHTDMVNTGVNPNARGRIDGTLTHQVNANTQRLKLTLLNLDPRTTYQLLAFIGDDANPTSVTELSTDAKGALVIMYVQKCPGNSSQGGAPLPEVLDPITRIHQLDIVKDGNVALTGVIGSDLRADCTAPAVTLTVPADAGTGVALNQVLAATFSEPMTSSTLRSSFTLKRGATLVPGLVTGTGTMASFKPARDLAPNTVYTATITTRARDLGGNGLTTNFVWKFTTGAAPVATASLRIGYTEALAVANYSQPLMNQISQLRWFFAHASVGEWMKEGIGDLHQANPNFYQLQYAAATDTAPAATQPGLIYEYMRGNPGWPSKVDGFENYVSGGWHAPLIDVAMNKMCWIDQAADVNYYINSMTHLESAYPQTVFVYATMPLDTSASVDNYERNVYNDTLRNWCRTNNRVLFDIADMEAHDTHGTPVTFTFNNQVCQKLFQGYTSDSGHPDSVYARQLLARGFYALAAALTTKGLP